jgi:hypothetical protein
MAYIVNKFSGAQLLVLEDGTIDTSTSLGLVGRNYVGYGETQNENFVFLLENFANVSPPSRPLQGQVWFNTTAKLAYAYDGNVWSPIGAATLSTTAPLGPNAGALWLDTTLDQLKVYTGNQWVFIGAEAVAGFGITKARSTTLDNTLGNAKPVIILTTNDNPVAIITAEAFNINASSAVAGFDSSLIAGINLSSTAKVKGDITGNSGSADKLSISRTINGVGFDGQQNITVKSSTTNKLFKGTYITGSDFDGGSATTWAVDATPSNIIGKVVARNSEGGFSAGTIDANFVGNLTGNVTATIGTSTFNVIQANSFIGSTVGNASTAAQLQTARKINGVNFDGTSDITVPAAATTLTGAILNSTVIQSSLQQVGTLIDLNVNDSGVNIGSAGQLRMFVASTTVPTIRSSTGTLNFDMGPSGPDISFVNSSTALSYGADNAPAIISGDARQTNIGFPSPLFGGFNKVYANEFKGTADNTDRTFIDSTNTVPDPVWNDSTTSTKYRTAKLVASAYSIAARDSNGNITANVFTGVATAARYSDLAENYVADADYSAGTVLMIGGPTEVTLASADTTAVAGIVSTEPAHLMNSACTGEFVVAVALQGRVPCKVVGKIRKGDIMISAGQGYARSCGNLEPKAGQIIGKALEDFHGELGEIEIMVGRS